MSGPQPGERPLPLEVNRPLVTLHLPLEMGLVGQVLQLVAEAYPGAVVGNGTATATGPDGTTYSTDSVMFVLGQEVPA